MTAEEDPEPSAGGQDGQRGPTLKRGLGLTLLTLYGLGTIIGAGIYVLIGKVAGLAGLYAPLAFLLASLLAAFTVFSFAELSSRFTCTRPPAVVSLLLPSACWWCLRGWSPPPRSPAASSVI